MTKPRGHWVIAAAAVLALTGCGGAATSTPSPAANTDAVFLSTWREKFPNTATDAAGEKTATQIAHGVCDAYKAGTTFAGEVSYLQAMGMTDAGLAGWVIGAATSSYCPEYNNRH